MKSDQLFKTWDTPHVPRVEHLYSQCAKDGNSLFAQHVEQFLTKFTIQMRRCNPQLHPLDFYEDAHALIPQTGTPMLEHSYRQVWQRWESKHPREVRDVYDAFGEHWIIFFFLLWNFSATHEDENFHDFQLQKHFYLPLQNVESYQFFTALSTRVWMLYEFWGENDSRKKRRIQNFTQKFIQGCILDGLITIQLRRQETNHAFRTYEIVQFYHFPHVWNTNRSYVFRNYLFRAPPQLRQVSRLLQNGGEQEVTLVFSSTFLRAAYFTTRGRYNTKSFQFSDLPPQPPHLNVPLYPDLPFLKLLRRKFLLPGRVEDLSVQAQNYRQELRRLFHKKQWSISHQQKWQQAQKDYARVMEELKELAFLDHPWHGVYYFLPTHDWRGRRYYLSPISPTTFKMSRVSFHYGFQGSFHPARYNWDAYREILQPFFDSGTAWNSDRAEVIAFLLMSIGKFHPERKGQNQFSCQALLRYGVQLFHNPTQFPSNHDDWLEFYHQIFTLRQLGGGDCTQRVICKDATASGTMWQFYILSGDEKNAKFLQSLRDVNLSDDENFYDTYTVITEHFKRVTPPIPPHLMPYFTRRLLKKVYMIIPYAAGDQRCFQEIQSDISPEHWNEMRHQVARLRRFVLHELWAIWGLPSSLPTHLKITPNQVTWEGGTVDLNYYHLAPYRLDVRYQRTRITRQLWKVSKRLDKKKTATGKSANLVHFYEASFLRTLDKTNPPLKIISIHDAFLPSIFECGFLVESYGKYFYKRFGILTQPPRTTLL